MDSLTFHSETKVTPPQLIPQTLPLALSHQSCHPGGIVVMGSKNNLGDGALDILKKANGVIKDSQGPLVKGTNRI